MVSKKRFQQLKFIASIFNLSLKEIEDVLGKETLTMIFRRVGETSGEKIVNRFNGAYKTLDEFCTKLIQDVIDPIVGSDKAKVDIQGDKITFTLHACPYKKAGGFPIEEMGFFCHYTEGMLDTSLKMAFPDKSFEMNPKELKSDGCSNCLFEITSK